MATLYKFGQQLSELGLVGYLQEDWRQTKKDFSSIKTFGEGIAYSCEHPLTVLYPLLGNLSGRVQIGLEDLVGKEQYDSEKAAGTSAIVNIGAACFSVLGSIIAAAAYKLHLDAYSLLDQLLAQGPGQLSDVIATGVVVLSAYTIAESGYRWSKMERTISYKERLYPGIRLERYAVQSDRCIVGSLLGKVASLPIEFFMGLYDGMKSKKEKNIGKTMNGEEE